MDHHTRPAGTNILVRRGGKVLLHRRANTGWADGMLGIPGGHLEVGETARRAAVRELEEELGLKVVQDRLQFFATGNVRTNHEYVYYEFILELGTMSIPSTKNPKNAQSWYGVTPPTYRMTSRTHSELSSNAATSEVIITSKSVIS